MQSMLWVFLLLIWSSVVNSAPVEEPSPSPELSLGDKVFKKQEECEGMISDAIDEILDDEDSDLHDIPVPDDTYYDCKEELGKLKREYMSANRIDKSTYSEFFPLKLSDNTLELISVPSEEGEEVKEMEFDVNEELCVTSRKCARILDLIDGDEEKRKLYNERFGHCNVLLNDVKLKYIDEKGLDTNKLKEKGGLSVVCTGKDLLLPLPHTMNNLDYHQIHSGDESTSPPPPSVATKTPDDHQEEQNHTPEAGHEEAAKETTKHLEGPSSSGYVQKSNLIYCALIVFMLVTIM